MWNTPNYLLSFIWFLTFHNLLNFLASAFLPMKSSPRPPALINVLMYICSIRDILLFFIWFLGYQFCSSLPVPTSRLLNCFLPPLLELCTWECLRAKSWPLLLSICTQFLGELIWSHDFTIYILATRKFIFPKL